jgi:hypothetical protein
MGFRQLFSAMFKLLHSLRIPPLQGLTAQGIEQVRSMPVMELGPAQQALLNDLLSGIQEAPSVSAVEPDLGHSQRELFTGTVANVATSGSTAFQASGSSIAPDLMSELDKKMAEGSELFAGMEARAASFVGRDDVLSVPKPIALAGCASAVSVVALVLLSASSSHRAIQVLALLIKCKCYRR